MNAKQVDFFMSRVASDAICRCQSLGMDLVAWHIPRADWKLMIQWVRLEKLETREAVLPGRSTPLLVGVPVEVCDSCRPSDCTRLKVRRTDGAQGIVIVQLPPLGKPATKRAWPSAQNPPQNRA